MLKTIRITLSLIFFSLITIYFLDFTGNLPHEFHAMEMIQFVPALLAMNWIILLVLLVLTALFGRVYCSSICPLGIYQDIVSWFRKRLTNKKHRKRYKYLRAMNILRWSFLGATIIAFLFGFSFLVGLLDPYSAFGRILVHVLKPAYLAGNNLLASLLIPAGNFTFYKVGVYLLSLSSTVIALVTLIIISIMAWRNGRIYCNTVCPVGTLLGFISKHALYQIRFDSENCTLCGRCARTCKASCIDFKNMTVDASRCINCFNCIEECKESGLKFKRKTENGKRKAENNAPSLRGVHKVNDEATLLSITQGFSARRSPLSVFRSPLDSASRRRFLTALSLTALAAGRVLADKTLRLGPKKNVARTQPIMPPGAFSIEKFSRQCTSCHLCVSKCPAQIIKPAFLEYGIGGVMQPMLDFKHQFCNYDCTICADVCPTGALTHLDQETKHHTQIGRVQLYLENCIVYTDETSCGACSEHCPTQAVHMVPYKGHLTIPEINPEICVGCGGCEFICPSQPWKAIFVEGVTLHKTIELKQEEVEQVEVEGFGF
ncbi:MAG: 4Fe-4S dicluster domain-containing protein [Paludibacter sp.]|jgi:ferredoxin|nr:4Fe-4S dicluster domain-containing protein [Paludibacter sp.]